MSDYRVFFDELSSLFGGKDKLALKTVPRIQEKTGMKIF